jgi:membrane protein DedA with SNARE-associated domain
LLHQLIDPILQLVKDTIASWGYTGIVIMMAIESANIPLPSEAIMPTAGMLVHQQKMNIHLAALSGALGCLLGSIPSYWLGLIGGRPFLEKYGKLFLLKHKDLDFADRWVDRYGDITFFICRLLPVVRTFISFPAGVLRAHFILFCALTFVGSLIWCYFLTWVGIKFGENLESFISIWHKFDMLIVVLIGIGLIYYLIHHFRQE